MPQRFQHILVPVDFTEKNEAALQIALDVALQNKSRVTLLHVIETIGEIDEEIERFYERLQERAEASLTSLSQAFEAARVAVEWKTRPIIDHGRDFPSVENLLSVFPGRATLWPQLAEDSRKLVLEMVGSRPKRVERPMWLPE